MASDFTKAALHAWLDAAGVPFRAPLGDLIDQFGTQPAPVGRGRTQCILPDAGRLLSGAAGHIATNVTNEDLRYPPKRLDIGMQETWIKRLALGHALRELETLFGAGAIQQELSQAWVWQDGFAKLWLRGPQPYDTSVYKPDHPHARAKRACSVEIEPDTACALTVQEQSALVAPELILAGPLAPGFTTQGAIRAAEGPSRPDGVWRSASGDWVILRLPPQRMLILPRNSLTCVWLDVLKPAKGGGGAWLGLDWLDPDAQRPEQAITLKSCVYDARAELHDAGAKLADQLDLGFRQTDGYDA